MVKIFNSEVKLFSFQNMPKLDDFATLHIFKKGHILFYKEHLPYGLFVLITGQVEIEYDEKKKEVVDSSALLGITAFNEKTPYSATAKALTNCSAYFISFTVFQDLCEKNHQIALWLKKF